MTPKLPPTPPDQSPYFPPSTTRSPTHNPSPRSLKTITIPNPFSRGPINTIHAPLSRAVTSNNHASPQNLSPRSAIDNNLDDNKPTPPFQSPYFPRSTTLSTTTIPSPQSSALPLFPAAPSPSPSSQHLSPRFACDWDLDAFLNNLDKGTPRYITAISLTPTTLTLTLTAWAPVDATASNQPITPLLSHDGTRAQSQDGGDMSSIGLSGGALAGIVIGGILGIVLIAGIVRWLVGVCRRKREKKGGNAEERAERAGRAEESASNSSPQADDDIGPPPPYEM
ncbi:hypothetical protein B0T21DRAFT_412855 [Apiosordaria backusii]|uniref:Uncharacterized protein n=1 Tax=Apiosordaria backusii TaxID=314023 RepID=A0AA40BEC0_9PEZI|nr:hypothetical protein B0T21DRAFT_412855 [Apiosordaria backusii]